MKINSYSLFLLLLIQSSFASILVPNFCTVSDPSKSKCPSQTVTIHVIKDDMLFTTTETTAHYDYGNFSTDCIENRYQVTVPIDEVAFWKTGDVIHLPSLSTFPKSKSCVEVNCINGKNNHKIKTCIPKPVLPICTQNRNETDSNEFDLEQRIQHHTVQIKLGDYKSVVKVPTHPTEIACTSNETIYNVSVMNDGRSDLSIHGNSISLIHRHSPIALPNHIQPPKFCINPDDEMGQMKASYCFPDSKSILEKTCYGKHCVVKCCPPGYIYDGNTYFCVHAFHSSNLWEPIFYDRNTYTASKSTSIDYSLVIGLPHCAHFYSISASDGIKLLSTGIMFVENGNFFVPPSKYCIDNFIHGEDILEEAYICFEEESASVQSSCNYVGRNIYPYLLLTSSIFLLLTIITYCMVPELHAKIQSKCLISSVTSLLFAYLALGSGQLYSSLLSQNVCIVLGIFIQFSVLASFFWLNIMCFDIWHTLRSIKPIRDVITNTKKKFLMYSLYGWGCPLVISSITTIMQFLVEPKHNPNLIFPEIGETDCFFSTKDPVTLWLYLYSYICGILLINFVFFIHLAVTLIKAQHTSEITLGKRGQYREWIKLYVKLFFVMGVSWMFEVISWHKKICAVW